MEYRAIVDYNRNILKLFVGDNSFGFDLNEGDAGDFWHSFSIRGQDYDINLYEDEGVSSLTIYEVVDGLISTGKNDVLVEDITVINKMKDLDFRDSYGERIVDGDKIIIEEHWQKEFSSYNGKKANVLWNSDFGLYEWILEDKPNHIPSNFFVLKRFKKEK